MAKKEKEKKQLTWNSYQEFQNVKIQPKKLNQKTLWDDGKVGMMDNRIRNSKTDQQN